MSPGEQLGQTDETGFDRHDLDAASLKLTKNPFIINGLSILESQTPFLQEKWKFRLQNFSFQLRFGKCRQELFTRDPRLFEHQPASSFDFWMGRDDAAGRPAAHDDVTASLAPDRES